MAGFTSVGHEAGWVKLHHINQRIANHIGVQLSLTVKRGKRQHIVPEVVAETCEILGRGTEEDIKNRIGWLRLYYPAQFNEPLRAAQ
jgi:C-terminal processing protease CtpA/Prc